MPQKKINQNSNPPNLPTKRPISNGAATPKKDELEISQKKRFDQLLDDAVLGVKKK